MQYVKFGIQLFVFITLITGLSAGTPYEFSYTVKDDFGNDFGHKATSNGDLVVGEYRTLLPDGRIQVVKYQADSINGYNANVLYLVPSAGNGDQSDPGTHILKSQPPSAQRCADGRIGVNCNHVTAVEDTVAEEDR